MNEISTRKGISRPCKTWLVTGGEKKEPAALLPLLLQWGRQVSGAAVDERMLCRIQERGGFFSNVWLSCMVWSVHPDPCNSFKIKQRIMIQGLRKLTKQKFFFPFFPLPVLIFLHKEESFREELCTCTADLRSMLDLVVFNHSRLADCVSTDCASTIVWFCPFIKREAI